MATLTPASEDTRIYEYCVLYPHPMNQKEEKDLLTSIEELFAEAGAKMVFKDLWGRRGLAFPIAGFKEGSYVVYYFDMDPSKVKEIESQLKIMKGVLRFIAVKPPKHYQVSAYAERFAQWKEEAKADAERKENEKENKLKKQVLDKAKRTKKPEPVAEKAQPAVDITQKLDKLISDDAMDL